ncbi:MAG: SusC/RagA family TonB-linked outer membrane protein, partial [Muribaculaceae bacterium]|nr:SusC/RagA family TonB-linked outer membrane protein [Muribaculaceae bacterium]
YKDVRIDASTENLEVKFYDWVGKQTSATQNSPAKLEEENREWTSYTLGLFAQYNRLFAEKHQVDAMLGITGENEDYKRLQAGRYKGELYPGSGLSDLNVFQGGDNNSAGGGSNSWSFLSYVGDLRYAFEDTYLVSFLWRHDGSSRLTPENRWKDFYSVSGGWIFTNEDFFRNLNIDQWMNFGKIRYNFGKTGSVNGIGNYESYSTIKTGTVYLGGNNLTSMWIDGMRSSNRTWETLISHDAGIDLGFFSNRLRASFDWFSKTNNGMFIDVVYPQILGASAPKTNNGKLNTRGWEVEVSWNDNIGDFRYNVGFNIADAQTRLKELTSNENVPNPGHNKNRLIDKPLDAIYLYQTDGVFQNQEEVDAYYEMYYWNSDHSGPKSGNVLPAPSETGTNRLRPGARKRVDIDGDGVITVNDIYYAGDAAPRLSFGIKGGLSWKGIDFSFFFQGIGKQNVLRSGNMYAPFVVNYCLQNNTFLGKTWTPENGSNEYTVMSRDNSFNRFNYENSDVSLQNNRYMRLKNLVVGYTLPRTVTQKVGVEKFRVYFSGDDLWEWTKIKDGYDPEYGEGSNNIFPLCRLLNFGVELEF